MPSQSMVVVVGGGEIPPALTRGPLPLPFCVRSLL